MNRAEKHEAVIRIKSLLDSSSVVILSHNKGLNVTAANKIRKRMKATEGSHYFIAKNTLMKLAVSGTKYESLTPLLNGPIAVACGVDPISVSKTLVSFIKEEANLEIVGGATAEEELDLSKIKMLASLPSFDEMRSKLLSVLQAPAAQIARVIAAYAEKS